MYRRGLVIVHTGDGTRFKSGGTVFAIDVADCRNSFAAN